MADDKKQVLDKLIQRKDALQAKVSRVKGRLDSARRDLQTVEEDCLKKKIDPKKLDDTIAQLKDKFTKESADLDRKIKEAEISVTPFLEEQ